MIPACQNGQITLRLIGARIARSLNLRGLVKYIIPLGNDESDSAPAHESKFCIPPLTLSSSSFLSVNYPRGYYDHCKVVEHVCLLEEGQRQKFRAANQHH